jgi:hypothetical protein
VNDVALRVCLNAYPPEVRERDGRVILDLARDLSSKGGCSMMREAAGMLRGGLRARAKALRLDLTTAPWRDAMGRLTMPLAIALLCLMVGYVTTMLQPDYLSIDAGWLPVWAGLGLLGALAVVAGAVFGRRPIFVPASFVVMVLMLVPTLVEIVGYHTAVWSGTITTAVSSNSSAGIGVDVFVLWAPVAVLLPICALFREGKPARRLPGSITAACLALAASVLLGLVPSLASQTTLLPDWSSTLGGAFVCAPLILVAVTAVAALLRADPASETSAALLVATACLPAVWLTTDALTTAIPGAISGLWSHPDLWLLYYAIDAVLICSVIWVLLRHRRIRIGQRLQT